MHVLVLKFGSCLNSTAAETPAKFQSKSNTLKTDVMAFEVYSIEQDIL